MELDGKGSPRKDDSRSAQQMEYPVSALEDAAWDSPKHSLSNQWAELGL